MTIERPPASRAVPAHPSVPSVRSSHGSRPPRSRPLLSAADALDVVSLATHWPPRDETIVLLLDAELTGRTCVIVDGTGRADDVLDVAHVVLEVATRDVDVHAAVLASVRVGEPEDGPAASSRSDVDRWLELLDAFDDAGVELLDWFTVLDDQPESLRSATGMPSLWPER
jgi:hypothetical protein